MSILRNRKFNLHYPNNSSRSIILLDFKLIINPGYLKKMKFIKKQC